MQRFLGSAVYFKPVIENYSQCVAPLHDTTKKAFDWNEETWTVDYRAVFERFKLEILNFFTLYHPDYSLKWILKTDASDYAVGGVLVQVFILSDGTEQYQVIAFVSMKLSAQPQNWSTIEKECFGIFYSVKKLSYYLFGKRFTLQTDHSNLLWMQKSEVAKIIRQRIYLQNYDFVLQHIRGPDNKFADWTSRQDFPDNATALPNLRHLAAINLTLAFRQCDTHSLNAYYFSCTNIDDFLYSDLQFEFPMSTICALTDAAREVSRPSSVTKAIAFAHNGRMGHHGVRRTWLKLNKVS